MQSGHQNTQQTSSNKVQNIAFEILSLHISGLMTLLGKIPLSQTSDPTPPAERYWLAFDYFTKAANLGYSDSMYKLGEMYLNGQVEGYRKDSAEALARAHEHFFNASDYGNPGAMYQLGKMYLNGQVEGYPKDSLKSNNEASSNFASAANAGYVYALYELGKMYRESNLASDTLEYLPKDRTSFKNTLNHMIKHAGSDRALLQICKDCVDKRINQPSHFRGSSPSLFRNIGSGPFDALLNEIESKLSKETGNRPPFKPDSPASFRTSLGK